MEARGFFNQGGPPVFCRRELSPRVSRYARCGIRSANTCAISRAITGLQTGAGSQMHPDLDGAYERG
jgi:hypothetical protein